MSIEQINNFQSSENKIGQNYNGAKIKKQKNIFCGYHSFKPLENFNGTIKANKNFIFDKFAKRTFIISYIFTGLYIPILFGIEPNIFLSFFYSFLFLSILISLFWAIGTILGYIEITINENELKLKSSKEQKIEFSKIRSFLKIDNMSSYSFYIYELNKTKPIFKFKIFSTHESLATEELLISKCLISNKKI